MSKRYASEDGSLGSIQIPGVLPEEAAGQGTRCTERGGELLSFATHALHAGAARGAFLLDRPSRGVAPVNVLACGPKD